MMKNKLFTALLILLLILNAATLGTIWLKKGHHPPREGHFHPHPDGPGRHGGPGEMLIRELKFDSVQKKSFEALRNQHHAESERIMDEILKGKKSLLDKMRSDTPDKAEADKIASHIGELQKELELLLFNHFSDVRKLCRAEQKTRFDEILAEMKEHIRMPGPVPHAGGPPEGPPPPPGE